MQYNISVVDSSAVDLYLQKMSIRNVVNKHALWYAGHSTFSVSYTWQVVWQRQPVWSCEALSKSHTVFQTGCNQARSSMSTLGAADTSGTWQVPLCVVFDLEEILHLTSKEIWFLKKIQQDAIMYQNFYSSIFIWTCSWWTLSGTVCLTTSISCTSNNPSCMKNQRLPVQF